MTTSSMGSGIIKTVGSASIVELDAAIYSQDAVIRAAHRLSGSCTPVVESADGKFVVRLQGLSEEADPEAIGREFLVAALDEVLRYSLREKTEALRAVIVAEAFSKTSILRPELTGTDPGRDPLEIGQPDAATGRHHD